MANISDLSDEELMRELQRRNVGVKIEKLVPPTAYSIRAIHWEHLYEICEKHVADIEAGSVEEDKKQYIYEAAMTAVFGEKVWDWIGAKTRGA